MISWLFIAISSYLIFSVTTLVDKYLLSSRIPNPKILCFYIACLSLSVVFLIPFPFAGFEIPSFFQIILALFAGATFIFWLFLLYRVLRVFEASRVFPTIGALSALMIFLSIYIFSEGREVLDTASFVAFVLLVLGGFLINYRKNIQISSKVLLSCLAPALILSLYFILSKYVYLNQPFLSGFIWTRIGSFLAGMIIFLLFLKEIKGELSRQNKKSSSENKKTAVVFLANQTAGAAGVILSSWAIALAPLASVSIVNALQGIQYAFMFIFAIFISWKFPKILKEDISKEIIFQKIIAIILIAVGLAILAS
ncbi:MAG: hypothetical protein COX37_01410 [Candidatus Nealsonbacteria bacterium CG23_combo_of_CG06-09_8_20_14_all_39_17]|uniref:EamA domain-containing protein n=1 Tax=Candidatus Nealsonbacteria bacterium CG23_combo_of_CG06-09_8_20_14_all_39_17 TaxID=1974722 RepID=A0A2G9YUI9_9BACT|nr:MAG: hypothetical protein COX37_01410 [Candidatus Nealsonbacteria bacterium CG23_combo_of_CG06-09_8_20_14_all_39_17]